VPNNPRKRSSRRLLPRQPALALRIPAKQKITPIAQRKKTISIVGKFATCLTKTFVRAKAKVEKNIRRAFAYKFIFSLNIQNKMDAAVKNNSLTEKRDS
jgi:hypothetical protein